MKRFLILFLFIFVSGCGGGTTVKIEPETCYIPDSIRNEDRDKIIDFTLSLSTALKGAPDVNAKIGDKTKITYPDAADINRIYALSYAACVACRVNPGNVQLCASAFDTVIKQTKAKESGRASLAEALQYKQKLLDDSLLH
jgi:hypothetical protein